MLSMKLALIHLAVAHKKPEQNRKRLVKMFERAGRKGANLVITPELAVSGYSFADYQDMLPYAETVDGPTLTEISDVCSSYGMYGCVGLAERDPHSNILYNSAFVLGPDGTIVARYRKINAELRWACPGDATQDNTFATPWGRIGILICSDSYHSLMPRITALRGANLLLILANWPPTGLDPLEIWQARALENGMFVAGCNRTGVDLIMDCCDAPSACFSPSGTALLKRCINTSKLMKINIFLNDEGKIKSGQRLKRLAARPRNGIHSCYLNVGSLPDLTSFLQLPPPGQLLVYCHCPEKEPTNWPSLFGETEQLSDKTDVLHILPPAREFDEIRVNALRHWCGTTGQKVLFSLAADTGLVVLVIDGEQELLLQPDRTPTDEGAEFCLPFDCGHCRIHILPCDALYNPETVLASAKKGADLVVMFCPSFNDTVQLLAGARTIEQVAVAVCSPKGAGIWMPPEGHQRWAEVLAEPGGHCQSLVDSTKTRKKRFQDRIDYQTLLRGPQVHREEVSEGWASTPRFEHEHRISQG